MKKISLGKTDLTVSALCMGTVYFGSRMDDEASIAMLDHFAALAAISWTPPGSMRTGCPWPNVRRVKSASAAG